jgi:ribosomal protein L44E
MSRAEFIAASCSGKVRFETFDQAQGVAKARNRGKAKRVRLVYRCTTCKGFHISGNTAHRTRRMKD